MGSLPQIVNLQKSSLTDNSMMNQLVGALVLGMIGLSICQGGGPPAAPAGTHPPTLSLLLGGGLGGSSGSTDSLLPLLLLGGGGKGGFGGLGGHGGINPLMLSLLSCKEPVTDCQKPNEGSNLCGNGASKPCCTCTGGLFG